MLRASEESPRMFESDIIDFFSRTPWWVIPTVWLPVAGLFFALGVHQGAPLGLSAAGWLCGFVLWTFAEYSLHRTAFHWIPDTSWGERYHFFVHGVHHEWHWDKYRLVMPPAASVVLCLLFGGLFRLVLGPTWMWPIFSGFVVGYVVYDCLHYAEHHLKLKWKWFVKLRAHHMSHHHNKKYLELRFGVSSMFWDRVFGTMEPKRG